MIVKESPYGDSGVTYSGALAIFNHFILQLKSFRSLKKTKEESDYLESDIRGYELILESKSEANAEKFLELKTKSRLGQLPRFKDNLAVIEHMKETGVWHEQET